jgi:hypothetical protein
MPGPSCDGRPIEAAAMGPERGKECDWTRVRNSTGLVPTVLRGNAVPDAPRRLAAATWGRPDSRNGVRAGERRANRKTTRSVEDGIPTRSVGTSFRCNTPSGHFVRSCSTDCVDWAKQTKPQGHTKRMKLPESVLNQGSECEVNAPLWAGPGSALAHEHAGPPSTNCSWQQPGSRSWPRECLAWSQPP